jgi:3-hydroxyacyl-CoA dehydrogenase/enoyl-CoA hydratase/3-hydroxybutyryl-CoA epimerase
MTTQSAAPTPKRPQGAFSLAVEPDGIAVVSIDVPGETQNILKAEFVQEADALLDGLQADKGVNGLVFISAKPGSFIAGADINMLRACKNPRDAAELARAGQRIFQRIATFKAPVVAAIEGTCLGGGLELALACQVRVCTDAPATTLGLPEVMLGILPGSGGTQRLPRLVGIAPALDMLLTGRPLTAAKARRVGLVDEVVPGPILRQAALQWARALRHKRTKPAGANRRTLLQKLTRFVLEGNRFGRSMVLREARGRMLAKTKGHYPAPKRIIDCVEIGTNKGFHEGLEAEARYFGELAVTPEARELMGIYLATTAMKKETGVTQDGIRPRAVKKIGVLGAGLMGAGIGFVSTARAGVPVRFKDRDPGSLCRGLQYIHKRVEKRRARHSITPFEAQLEMGRISPCLDYSGFQNADLVIEAVFEDLALKQQMVKDVETHCRADTIFATNTSSIPVTRIAATARRPERIVGMHYFSPVEKMPLLEVVASANTAPEVVASAVDFGRRQGKTVIVVKDGPGFYVNRILAPYIGEAARLLEQGVAIDTIDRELSRFGFPLGPFALLDEVGIDVASKVGPLLYETFGERMKPFSAVDSFLADGRLGRKSRKGFYLYPDAKKGLKKGGKIVDESVYDLLEIKTRIPTGRVEIIERCVLLMVNEAARCWDEGVIRSPRDGDIGAVFGIGFPPFLGGPFRYADRLGINQLVAKLQTYQQRLGGRFAPAPVLHRLARQNMSFHEA